MGFSQTAWEVLLQQLKQKLTRKMPMLPSYFYYQNFRHQHWVLEFQRRMAEQERIWEQRHPPVSSLVYMDCTEVSLQTGSHWHQKDGKEVGVSLRAVCGGIRVQEKGHMACEGEAGI